MNENLEAIMEIGKYQNLTESQDDDFDRQIKSFGTVEYELVGKEFIKQGKTFMNNQFEQFDNFIESLLIPVPLALQR